MEQRNRGFTLVELVMVIVILGILAAIAIPRFINLQIQARDAAGDAEIGALRSAAVVYYATTAINGPTAAYPGSKTLLTAQLNNPLSILTPIGTTDRNWTYTSSSGRVVRSGTGWGN